MASRALLSRLPALLFSSSSRSLSLFRFSTLRLRPVIPLAERLFAGAAFPGGAARSLSTRATTSSLNDPQPNWSNRPPKETILLDGCDFEHWLVVMEPPDPSLTRDEIIDSYIKTLAQVVGSEQEARMKIYSVSTKHYFAFGALVSEELSYKIKELPKVRWVLPDSYLDVKNKDYGGEPFINGEAVPYDPKYHEEWVRNNARANERSRRNDRPRNFDRSRNFERRRENMMNFQNREAPPMQNREPPRDSQASNMPGVPNRDMPTRDHGGMQGHGNQGPVPGPQGSYIPNRDGAGYPASQGPQPGGQSFQGSLPGGNPPVAPGYGGAGQGYRPGGPSGAGGAMPGAPGYQGGNPGGYQGSQGYQGINPGGSPPGYQGTNPGGSLPGYQGTNPGGSPPGAPTYQGGNQAYQGNYQGSAQGYQGGGQTYQGNNSGYQGGGPGYQGGSQGYQGNSGGYQGGSGYQQGGGPGYQVGNQGYQGGGPGYQAPVSGNQGYPAQQGRDVGGRDL